MPLDTVRVDIEELDRLIQRVTEVGIQLGSLERDVESEDQVTERALVPASNDFNRQDP